MPHRSSASGTPAARAPAPSSTTSSPSPSASAATSSHRGGRSGASKGRREVVDDPPASLTLLSPPSSDSAKKPRLFGPDRPESMDTEMVDADDDASLEETKAESSRTPVVHVKKPVVSVPTAPVTGASSPSPATEMKYTDDDAVVKEKEMQSLHTPVVNLKKPAVSVSTAPVTGASSPSSAVPTSPPLAATPSPTTSAVTGVNASAVTYPIASASTSPSLGNGPFPVWASSARLKQAGIDSRVPNRLVVEFHVDTRMSRAPVLLSRLYSNSAETKLEHVVQLLADVEAGFAIKPPTVPRVLLSNDAAARSQLTEEQQALCNELTRMAQQHGDLVRENKGPIVERADAVDTLFDLIAPSELERMWGRQALTSTWSDLLVQPSAILKSHGYDDKQRLNNGRQIIIPRRVYEVNLCGATLEVSYIIACTIASYALLPVRHKDVKRRLCDIVGPRTSQPQAGVADTASDPESSDDDGGFSTYTSRRAERRQNRRTPAIIRKQLKKFLETELSAAEFLADSYKPLLAFATRVTMRPWHLHFLECDVTNWQSVGCSARVGMEDAAFQRVVQAIPWLQNQSAFRWVPRSTVGDSAFTLFVREDMCRLVPEINQCLRQSQLPGMKDAALCVTGWARPWRVRDDQSDSDSRPAERFYLTAEKVRASARLPPMLPTNAEPGPSSGLPVQGRALPTNWASLFTRPVPGLRTADRRPATTQAIDHRPHKEQRRDTAHLGTAAPQVPALPKRSSSVQISAQQLAPWTTDLTQLRTDIRTELGAELTKFSAQFAALLDLPRQFANFQREHANQAQILSSPLILSSGSPGPGVSSASTSAPTGSTFERRMAALEANIVCLNKNLDNQAALHKKHMSMFEDTCAAQATSIQRVSKHVAKLDDVTRGAIDEFKKEIGVQLQAAVTKSVQNVLIGLKIMVPSVAHHDDDGHEPMQISSGLDALAAAAK